jgi:hypothetical protein
MHHVPLGVAEDYHARCAAEIERLSDQAEHTAAFIESVVLTIQPESFTTEQRAQLNEWLCAARSARKALRS